MSAKGGSASGGNIMNKKSGIKQQDGFIALMSVIIILAVLLVIGVSISFTGFSSRFNVADSEYKKRSSALAEACVDTEILRLAQNNSNTGTVPVGGDSCKIVSVATSTLQDIIKTQSVFPANTGLQSFTNLTVTVNASTFSVISWEETPN